MTLRTQPVPPRRGAILTLRPWVEVAAEFSRRTGVSITEVRARKVGAKAVRKLRRLLARQGVTA